MSIGRVNGSRVTRRTPGNPQAPKTIDYSKVDFDIFGDLLSFYVRTVNILVSRDLDEQTEELAMAGGTGKISTLLLVGANPGLQKVSSSERRARELYLTPKGRALAQQVREVARRQSDDFFSVLTDEEQDSLLRILRKVYESYVDKVPSPA